jgi:hypothetical protein
VKIKGVFMIAVAVAVAVNVVVVVGMTGLQPGCATGISAFAMWTSNFEYVRLQEHCCAILGVVGFVFAVWFSLNAWLCRMRHFASWCCALVARIGAAFYRIPLPCHSVVIATMQKARTWLFELHCVGVRTAR